MNVVAVICILLGVVLVFVGGIWAIIRSANSPDANAGRNVGVRISNDGFYLQGPLFAGTRVRYDCVVNGVRVTDVVALAGIQTFVYTGGVPSMVRVLEVIVVTERGWSGGGSDPSDFDSPDIGGSDDSFLGSPSAY